MNQNLQFEIFHAATQKAVHINPAVWMDYEAISRVIPHPETSINREELRSLALSAFAGNGALL